MRVKVSIPGKNDKIINVDGDCDLETFQGIILSTYDEDILLGGLRFGFPPQSLSFHGNESKMLEDLGISNGERIIITLPSSADATKNIKSGVSANEKKKESSGGGIIDSKRVLQVHEVPDDNSCLFHAISYAVYKDISLSAELRNIVASEVSKDTITYSDAILGRPNRKYSQWITKPSSWGGGIEIAVLSKHLQYAIYVLDMDACKFEKFNDELFNLFIIIAYNGVHYDTVEIVDGAQHQTVFNADDEDTSLILKRTEEIARKMKREGKTFNTTRDSILCNTCGKTLVGEREVSKHAETTGHVDFRQK